MNFLTGLSLFPALLSIGVGQCFAHDKQLENGPKVVHITTYEREAILHTSDKNIQIHTKHYRHKEHELVIGDLVLSGRLKNIEVVFLRLYDVRDSKRHYIGDFALHGNRFTYEDSGETVMLFSLHFLKRYWRGSVIAFSVEGEDWQEYDIHLHEPNAEKPLRRTDK